MSEVESRLIEIEGTPVTIFGHPDDRYFYSVCMQPDYDAHLSRIAAMCVSANDHSVVLDIGGNIGYFALSVAARTRRNGQIADIHAFEPARVNWEPFERSLASNAELASNIRLHTFGLSDGEREAEMNYTPSNTAGAHLSAGMTDHYKESERVTLRTLASVLDEEAISRIDVIKIDVEGHEHIVLSSIEDLIAKYQPAILIEVNGWVIDTVARSATSTFVDYLSSLAPYAYGVDSDGTYIDVTGDRTNYLRANLLAKTHQDIYLDFDPDRVRRVLAGFGPGSNSVTPTRDNHVGQATAPSPRPRKLNYGCGQDKRAGYLNVDMNPDCEPDVLVVDNDMSALGRESFDEIVANDVLEHIPRTLTSQVLLDFADLLSDGGTMRLQTSSILAVADQIAKDDSFRGHYLWTHCLFGTQAHVGDYHLTGFTDTTLTVHLLAAGFDLDKIWTTGLWLLNAEASKAFSWSRAADELSHLSDEGFVREAYRWALYRDADEASQKYLLERMSSGTMDRRSVMRHLMASPERLFVTAERHGFGSETRPSFVARLRPHIPDAFVPPLRTLYRTSRNATEQGRRMLGSVKAHRSSA